MKKIFVCVAIVFAVTISSAQASEICDAQSKLANTIMEARQNGMPMRQMMNIVGNDGDESTKLSRILVKAAYEVPRYHSEDMKARTATEFSNEVYLMCIKATED